MKKLIFLLLTAPLTLIGQPKNTYNRFKIAKSDSSRIILTIDAAGDSILYMSKDTIELIKHLLKELRNESELRWALEQHMQAIPIVPTQVFNSKKYQDTKKRYIELYKKRYN